MELKKINQNIINLKNDLTKSFSDTLIDSLHEVLIEFNNTFKSMVKEMVESNFKELNNTINTLNAWQIQHKEEVEFLKEAYSSLVSKHQAFVDYTEDWIEKLDEITGQSSRLQEVIDEFNEAFNDEGNLARMIKEITDTASILKSTTHEYAKVITEVNSTAELLRGTGEKLENVSKDVSLISENTNIIVEKTEALQKINLNHIDDLVAQFNNNLKSTFETFDSLIHEYIQNIENRLKTDVSEKNR
jgi:methyl-accepting chemotaxis protein